LVAAVNWLIDGWGRCAASSRPGSRSPPVIVAAGWGVYSVATFAASYRLDVRTTQQIQSRPGCGCATTPPPIP
jgi:hypothetical protein